MVIQFGCGSKPLTEYSAHELRWGAESQARHKAEEMRQFFNGSVPRIFCAIDCWPGESILVSFDDGTKQVECWKATTQLLDDGNPKNDLDLERLDEAWALTLLTLRLRFGSEAVVTR